METSKLSKAADVAGLAAASAMIGSSGAAMFSGADAMLNPDGEDATDVKPVDDTAMNVDTESADNKGTMMWVWALVLVLLLVLLCVLIYWWRRK